VRIPEDLVPEDARVEIEAKMAAGYFTSGDTPAGSDELASIKGRSLR
jgi:hypothetical protein